MSIIFNGLSSSRTKLSALSTGGIYFSFFSVEYNYFLRFSEDYLDSLTAYRSEMLVFHEELTLSGSIDMLFKLKDGTSIRLSSISNDPVKTWTYFYMSKNNFIIQKILSMTYILTRKN